MLRLASVTPVQTFPHEPHRTLCEHQCDSAGTQTSTEGELLRWQVWTDVGGRGKELRMLGNTRSVIPTGKKDCAAVSARTRRRKAAETGRLGKQWTGFLRKINWRPPTKQEMSGLRETGDTRQ